MLRFGRMKSLQKFASVDANVHNHFNLERHLIDRQTFKTRRSASLGWLAKHHGLKMQTKLVLRQAETGCHQTDSTK